MSARKALVSLLLGCAITVLASCGGSNRNVQNPAAPPSNPVAIDFQPAPPSTISLAGSATLKAIISNDPNNLGVDWVLLCQGNSNCGALSTLHSTSGAPVTYTPPSVISGNSQTFTIEAFATADHTSNVVANLAVTGFASNLKGTYVFETQGIDANGPFQLAGVIALDGNGRITSGEQTHSDSLGSMSDTISGGIYYIGPDGRGSLTITTGDQAIGQQGVENLSLVFLSNSEALIATMDDPNLSPSFETSSGTLELQTTTATPLGGYAFAVHGIDLGSQPMAMGGVLNIDSPGGISGTGSVADQDDDGTLFPRASISGTAMGPDALGSLKFNLVTSFSTSPVQFTGYIIDSQHIELIESDINGSGAGVGSTSGIAISQGAVTGSFTGNQSFAGSYVFGILGEDLSALPSSLASVGQFSSDGSGNLSSGYNDEFLEGNGTQISDSFSGTYAMDPGGTGRVDCQTTFGTHGPGPELIFYLTGNGNPALVLDADTTSDGLGSGLANPQTGNTFSFGGRYGLRFTQGVGPLENDAAGQITVNATAMTLSGALDSNLDFSAQLNASLSGTFLIPSNSGRFTGTLTNSFFPTPANTPSTLTFAFYLIDVGHGYFIETDSLNSGELTFGHLAARTPVCPTCQ